MSSRRSESSKAEGKLARRRAYNRAWVAAHPERVREIKRRWLAKPGNKERARSAGAAWARRKYAANKDVINAKRRKERKTDKYRRAYLAYKPKKLTLERKLRKARLGRVCDDCGRSDSEAHWSGRRDQCSRCKKRAHANGRCRFGHIRSRRRGTRILYCKECLENKNVGHVGAGTRVLTLWDMAWTGDGVSVSWADVARVCGTKEPSAKRQWARLAPWILSLPIDPVYDKLAGTVSFNPKRLRAHLEPLVDAVAARPGRRSA